MAGPQRPRRLQRSRDVRSEWRGADNLPPVSFRDPQHWLRGLVPDAWDSEVPARSQPPMVRILPARRRYYKTRPLAIRAACVMLRDNNDEEVQVGPMLDNQPVLSGGELRRICAIIRGERPDRV